MKTFIKAEHAARSLRQADYKYSHSTDTDGNVVEMTDPDARNHVFEHASGPARQVSYHNGMYYNIPANTRLVTSLVESELAEVWPFRNKQDKPVHPEFHKLLTRAGYTHDQNSTNSSYYNHPKGQSAVVSKDGSWQHTPSKDRTYSDGFGVASLKRHLEHPEHVEENENPMHPKEPKEYERVRHSTPPFKKTNLPMHLKKNDDGERSAGTYRPRRF